MRASIIPCDFRAVKPEYILTQAADHLRRRMLYDDLQAPYIRAALERIDSDLRDLADRRYRPAVLARWRGRMD